MSNYTVVSGVGSRKIHLQVPAFFGEDPYGWVLKAEKYFMLCGVEEGDKVAYATLCMEGKALNWLLFMEARNPIHGWEMFKHELVRRFGTTTSSAYERILSLKQLSTVANYREHFELLPAPLLRDDISDKKLLCAFINGLNDDVKAGVLELIRPGDLVRVMSLAQEIEDKLKLSERFDDVKLTRIFGNDSRTDEIRDKEETEVKEEQETVIGEIHKLSNSGLTSVLKPKEMGATGREEGGFIKRITEAEFNYKMKMSVCIRCDKKYSKNHKCKNKKLRIVVVKDEDEICDDEETEKEEEQVQNSSWILDSPDSKFLGKIDSRQVIVMVGIAATHNFISRKLVAALQIPVERTRNFRVDFGFGYKSEGAELCKRVVLKAQGIEIVERFFPIDLAIADLVLGNEWVRSLGKAVLQGNPMTLTFEWNGRTVTLQSDPSLAKGIESGLMMLQWI